MRALRIAVSPIALSVVGAIVVAQLIAPAIGAQTPGAIRGAVTRSETAEPLAGASVGIVGAGIGTTTATDGRFQLPRVPAGTQTVEFRAVGFAPQRKAVQVIEGQTIVLDVAMDRQVVRLSDMVVSTASRAPERIVEAPAAISVIPQPLVTAVAATGQVPLALVTVPGVDVTQNGVNDFNVNARGFNSSLTRRVLVLADGRDPSIPFMGSQEWSSLGATLDDLARIEMVRGPGSALYGANAFSGVLSLTSTTARDAAGTRMTIAAGELATRRIDARQAGLFAGNRLGYKVTGGYSTSDSWSRSRTRRDSTDIVREYAPATDSVVAKSRELRALAGQGVDSATLAAVGDRDPLTTAYGAGRIDYYASNGSLGTIEGGLEDVRNETFVTGVGRIQATGTRRPWARAAWGSDRLNVLMWYTGRDTHQPEWSLGSGTPLLEHSAMVHGELQYNNLLPRELGRWIVGASARSTHMNTSTTLIAPENDDRTDALYSMYGQLELHLASKLKLVTATRWDDGDLISPQFSPKAALVFTPAAEHSFRVSVNRAFQTPNYSEFFLHAVAGAPTASPRALETAIESFLATGRSLGTPGLPNELPWNFDAQTRVLALGNAALDVEKITGYEVGYQGALTRRGYLTIDLYQNDTRDFVTDLLPNVNPAYPQYRYDDGGTDVRGYLDAIAARVAALPPGSISDAQRQQLLAGAQALRKNYDALVAATQPLLTTVDGHRTLVVSYANAGKVTERGVEIGADAQLTDALRATASYGYFDFSIRQASVGSDALVPNTPRHKGSVALLFESRRGLQLNSTLRLVSGYPWSAGIFSGYIPASQTLNADVSFPVARTLRAFVTGTNVFDQQRFQIYGGSVVGRRILGGLTATFH
jgi:iron complex outermembrane receptor protein